MTNQKPRMLLALDLFLARIKVNGKRPFDAPFTMVASHRSNQTFWIIGPSRGRGKEFASTSSDRLAK